MVKVKSKRNFNKRFSLYIDKNNMGDYLFHPQKLIFLKLFFSSLVPVQYILKIFWFILIWMAAKHGGIILITPMIKLIGI